MIGDSDTPNTNSLGTVNIESNSTVVVIIKNVQY